MRSRPRIRPADVEAIVASALESEIDENGNTRYYGHVGDEVVRVVVARDDPGFVVTVTRRRRR